MFKKIFTLALLFCFTTTAASAAIFLKIPGVDGESQDDRHKNEIDVLAWSWSTQTNSRSTCIDAFNFVKYADVASPKLLMNQAQGVIYPTATMAVTRRGENPVEYILLEFKNLFVTSLSTGGSAGEDRLTENVTFNFEEVKYSYRPQNRDGSLGDPVSATITAGKNCN